MMKLQPTEARVWALVEKPVAELGLRLVRVRLSGAETQTLQLMIEPQNTGRDMRLSATVENCETVSRMVSALLDVEDPIAGAYALEVSTTGPERPLVTLQDFAAYAPHRVKIELEAPIPGVGKRLRGSIEGLEGEAILFRPEEAPEDGQDAVLKLPYTSVRQAILAYTPDELNEFYGLSTGKKGKRYGS